MLNKSLLFVGIFGSWTNGLLELMLVISISFFNYFLFIG